MDSLSANVSANLLGLGNAATPLGIQAATGMSRKSPGVASDELCTAGGVQYRVHPAAAHHGGRVRAAAGCAAPL